MRKAGTKAACLLLSATIGVFGFDAAPNVQAAAAKSSAAQAPAVKTIPQIIAKVSPSVVGIIGEVPYGYEASEGEEGETYDLAHGSGVIVRANGWIVTNAHVVDEMENIQVVTSEGKSYKVKEVYSDPVSDIALIRINVTGLKPAKFVGSTEKTLVGEQVIAIGTPVSLSLRNSATVGIVSGLNRAAGAEYRLIQTDATINPGNSGGPLVNLKGEILGINSMKYAAVDIDNTGFSIPAATVQYVIKQLFEYGEVTRAGLGLELKESFSATAGLPSDDPLTVTSVLSEEAEKAGVKEKDVLYSVAGKRITALVDLNELMKAYKPGQVVRVLMQSNGDIVERKIALVSE
ncbi:trypsin-like peptidase domain-containing protein [Saccharibacillus sp. CPCC 101409]|uniref:S1C family serine protease n=1 Tax=Saccharibacillus sp. CPCC 101409 TaxID=3058041 RepID=UPI002672866E|nr:trypsin-like peptidase domain-containing protein [Saccharibacillus sp. CPCC 101409]MDO3412032.1 trypsin-like peptidase domain-containing protein [Saccharibacillus sp. CPCC 101409]